MIEHLLRETLDVYRRTQIDDGYGGKSYEMTFIGTIQARLSQPTAAERMQASGWQAQVDYAQLYIMPTADVQRGDELRGSGFVFRVKSLIRPSIPIYLRVGCEYEQFETETAES